MWSKGGTVLLALLVSACANPPRTEVSGVVGTGHVSLFDATTVIQDAWLHIRMRGATDYRLAVQEGRVAIVAVGQESASGLFRHVAVDPERCPVLEWSWGVETLQPNADIRLKAREDVAASVFLLFGDPGFLTDPDPVPTLRYVWTNEKVPAETIVESPYLPGTVRSLVVESGSKRVGTWVMERRNVAQDFERAFGYPPKDHIQAIALFTDNDQTKQPVKAYYGWARVVCTP